MELAQLRSGELSVRIYGYSSVSGSCVLNWLFTRQEFVLIIAGNSRHRLMFTPWWNMTAVADDTEALKIALG